MSSIAKIVGCSLSTVSRALKHDQQISQEVANRIELVARELGYKVIKRPINPLQNPKNQIKNICLFFPYDVVEYSLTALDTFVFNNISRWAQKAGIQIHIIRLTEMGTLPGHITREWTNGFLMKSHQKPSLKKCPLLYNLPIVQMFAFAPNLDDDIQVSIDVNQCISCIFEELIPRKNYERIIVPIDETHLNHEICQKMALLEASCKTLNLQLHRLPMDSKLLNSIQCLSRAQGDTLVILMRCHDTFENILREQLKLIVPTCEVLMMTYDYKCSYDPTVHWLDMRGEDIVSLAWYNLLALIEKGYGVGANILIRPQLHLAK